jgi:hypothetical protein
MPNVQLSPAQIQQIERTVRRVPEVVVRVSSPQSNDFAAIRKYIECITCNGELALETDAGDVMRGAGVADAFMEAMDLDLERFRRRLELMIPMGRRLPKLVHKITLSMPQGTPPRGLLAAARNFLRDQFGTEHRYAFVLRTDKPHPHVQAVVKALSEQGIRLHIKKPILRRWRLEFARHLREQHIAANATERVLRGQVRASKPPALYHTERRGASTRLHVRAESVKGALRRRSLRTERGKSKLVQTRGVIERRWRAIEHALIRNGMTDLAEEVRRFVGEMQPPITDREQLARDLSSGKCRPRQNTPLFSR